MSASSSRSRKRRLKAAQERVDRVTQGDAKFFERFPNRSHRVRHAAPAELEQNALVTGVADPKPGLGMRWFVAVRQIGPGARIRLFVESAEDADVDMTEAEAKQVFDFVARSHDGAVAVERKLKAVLAKRGVA